MALEKKAIISPCMIGDPALLKEQSAYTSGRFKSPTLLRVAFEGAAFLGLVVFFQKSMETARVVHPIGQWNNKLVVLRLFHRLEWLHTTTISRKCTYNKLLVKIHINQLSRYLEPTNIINWPFLRIPINQPPTKNVDRELILKKTPPLRWFYEFHKPGNANGDPGDQPHRCQPSMR